MAGNWWFMVRPDAGGWVMEGFCFLGASTPIPGARVRVTHGLLLVRERWPTKAAELAARRARTRVGRPE